MHRITSPKRGRKLTLLLPSAHRPPHSPRATNHHPRRQSDVMSDDNLQEHDFLDRLVISVHEAGDTNLWPSINDVSALPLGRENLSRRWGGRRCCCLVRAFAEFSCRRRWRGERRGGGYWVRLLLVEFAGFHALVDSGRWGLLVEPVHRRTQGIEMMATIVAVVVDCVAFNSERQSRVGLRQGLVIGTASLRATGRDRATTGRRAVSGERTTTLSSIFVHAR